MTPLVVLGGILGAPAVGLWLVQVLSQDDWPYALLGAVGLVAGVIYYRFGVLGFIFFSLIGEPVWAAEMELTLTPVKILGFVVVFRRLIDLAFGDRLQIGRSSPVVLAAFFVLSLTSSLMTSRSIPDAMIALMTYGQLLIMFLLVIDFVREERQFVALLMVFALAGLVNAGLAVHEFYVEGTQRVLGYINNANRFGLVQLALFCLVIPSVGSLRSRWRSLLLMLVSGAIAYTTLLSFSRGTFVAGLGVVLYYFTFMRRGGLRPKLAMAAVVTLALWLAPEALYERIEDVPHYVTGTAQLDSSGQIRLQYYEAGIRMGLDYPLTGVGVGNFNRHLWSYTNLSTAYAGGAHNMYISIFAEAGAVSLVLLVGLLVTSLFAARRRVGDRLAATIGTGVELALVAFAVGGLFGTLEYSKALWILLALAVGIRKMAIRQEEGSGVGVR